MNDWRNAQPQLDRAREVIAQAERDFENDKKENPYKPGSEDWHSYELGWFAEATYALAKAQS